MGASRMIRRFIKARGWKQEEFAMAIGKDFQQLRNSLSKDSQLYDTVEAWLDAVDCELVIRDRKTGKIYLND